MPDDTASICDDERSLNRLIRTAKATILSRTTDGSKVEPYDIIGVIAYLYFQITGSNKTKCLGKGKGQNYKPMSAESQKYLQDYFRLYNEALVKILKRLGYTIPDWLQDDLKDDQKEH